MNPTSRPVSEDDLHAYVDGLLPQEDRARVERYLADHPDAAARIGDWQESRETLRRAFAHKAEEPIPAALNPARLAERRAARRWPPYRVAASIAAALIVGGTGGWVLRGPQLPSGIRALGMQAAMVQRVFATEGVQNTGFDARDRARIAGWAEARLGRPVPPPDLSALGFTLIDGHAVATESGPACMFMYGNGQGQRITILVRRMTGSDIPVPIRPIAGRGATGFAWMSGGYAYSVMASRPLPDLRTVSDRVRMTLDTGT